ncbi:prepilin-type N-terminal cleavage/methylation domain-containing protein [Luteolibacter ambystomatis]|uniref:Prepilin-type N-terminal cleavage/methylation domain-containing protein n=1 Tax=Luteolibacter ambystomatis TaxID=2824561 RepID=A0A975PGC1_9BACT|nr:prepilin-type N-terminal cleavage/methylation domain-containing protein [Luteolibacter ambystomatis]QUE52167.1 prepilin-type N-terminal cleavage/methylation domain-containing protein [Luteolibacter ambystomatis]
MKARRHQRGFTLIELSVAIMIGMAIGAIVLALANQQFTFLRIYSAQSFLVEEAPVVSAYMNRLIGQADRYRLHNSLTDAKAGTNAVLSNATVLVLNFQQPDGTARAGILAFQNLGTGAGNALYYYVVSATGTTTTPEWILTKRPSDVRFSIENGILRTRMTGPNGEIITYSGTMQQ